MRKLMCNGFALVLFFAIPLSSVAEDGLETKNLMASADSSITRSSPAFGKSSERPDGVLLTELDCEGGVYGPELCAWIEDLCCDSSPFVPDDPFCNKNWTLGMCGDCYHPCD